MQVRLHREELVGPFVERIRALPESRTVFHLICGGRRWIFRQWECGPLLPYATPTAESG